MGKGNLLVSLGYYAKLLQAGGLNNKHLFSTVLEAEKSKTKVLADSVSGEGLLPGL